MHDQLPFLKKFMSLTHFSFYRQLDQILWLDMFRLGLSYELFYCGQLSVDILLVTMPPNRTIKSFFLTASSKWSCQHVENKTAADEGKVVTSCSFFDHLSREGGGEVLRLIFAGYVPLASQSPSPYLIIVYSVANCRPHLSHFGANM